MKIRVPLIGSGTPDDPFRADLPTHALLEADYGRKLALVEVPEADIPPHPALRAALAGADKLADADQAPIGAAVLKVWHDHLDARYAEHPGRFRPNRK